MADSREIIIRIVNEESSENNVNKVDSTGEKTKKTKKHVSEESKIKEYIETQLIGQVTGLIIDETKYQLDRYFRLTDDYQALQSMNIALSATNRVKDAILNVGMSFAIGGGVAGIMSLGVEATKMFLDVYHNYDQQNIQIAKMNAQLQFNRERAGYALTAGSRGENR